MTRMVSTTPDPKAIMDANKRLEEKRAMLEAAKSGNNSKAIALLPNHISLIIDGSGSMGSPFPDYYARESRIDCANVGLQAIIAASDPKKTAYSVISLESRSHIEVKATTDYLRLQSRHYKGDMGGTDGIGAIRVAKYMDPPATRIIVLTDGEWGYPNEVYALVTQPRVIPIDTIAIGEGNDDFLKLISELTGGVFKRATDKEDLKNHFKMLEPRNYLQLTHG